MTRTLRTLEEIDHAIEDLQAAYEHALTIGDKFVVTALPPAIAALQWAGGDKYGAFHLTLRGARLFRRALTETMAQATEKPKGRTKK